MSGRTVVVTGANDGIGFEIVRALAGSGDRVGMVCRTRDRGEAAHERLAREVDGHRLDLFVADLSSQAQVRKLAAEIEARYPRLDVLVNNAGLICSKRTLSEDGIEMQLAVNHLAPFLLTQLLLDELRSTGSARVVNVASGAHARASIDLDDLGFERRRYSGVAAYGQSKLAMVSCSHELARRLDPSEVTVNCASPGPVRTRFGDKHAAPLHRAVNAVIGLLGRSPERGARTAVQLATSPDVGRTTGGYFHDEKPSRSSPASCDADLARRIWQASERLTGLG